MLRSSPTTIMVALVAIAAASRTASAGEATPACAASDLAAIIVIENNGERAQIQAPWLADAGLALLRARQLCMAGQEGKALALYDIIIDQDERSTADGIRRAEGATQ